MDAKTVEIQSFLDYQETTKKTAMYPKTKPYGVMYVSMGLMGEAGELIEKYRSILHNNNILTEEVQNSLKSEIGDVFWYISQICNELNLNLFSIVTLNISIEVDQVSQIENLILNTINQNSVVAKAENIYETCFDLIILVSKIIEKIKKVIRNKNGEFETDDLNIISEYLHELIIKLMLLIKSLNLKTYDVLNSNVQKLMSRLERGVIKSEGDNR